MSTRIRDTILDGNMGEGWTDQFAAAHAFAEHLEAAYRAEFGDDADISIDIRARTSGETPRLLAESDEPWTFESDPENRAYNVRHQAWADFCSNPPAELIA